MLTGRFTRVLGALLLCSGALSSETVGIHLKDGGATAAGKAVAKPGDWRSFLPALKAAQKEGKSACSIEIDAATPWSQLQAALTAAAASGFARARVPLNAETDLALDLPGGDAGNGDVVDFVLSDGPGETLLAENEGQKLPVNAELIKGLLEQLPKATVALKAPAAMPARKVIAALALLSDNRAASVAFLPLKEISSQITAEKKKPKDGEERASGIRRMVHGLAN